MRTPKKAIELPLTDAELRAPITKSNFFRRGLHYIKIAYPTGTEVPTIAYDPLNPSQAWREWREYFERFLHWVPLAMRKMLDRSPDAPLAMTVPTQRPEQFDQRFWPDQNWRPASPRLVTPKEHRQTLAQLQQMHGPGWGITGAGARSKPPTKAWVPPSDDELRAKYGPRHDEQAP